MAKQPLTNEDGDVAELGDDFFANAKRADEVMSPAILAKFRKARGPGRKPAKQQVTLRLDPRVIAHFKGDNPEGWQQRLGAALERIVEKA